MLNNFQCTHNNYFISTFAEHSPLDKLVVVHLDKNVFPLKYPCSSFIVFTTTYHCCLFYTKQCSPHPPTCRFFKIQLNVRFLSSEWSLPSVCLMHCLSLFLDSIISVMFGDWYRLWSPQFTHSSQHSKPMTFLWCMKLIFTPIQNYSKNFRVLYYNPLKTDERL